MCRKTIDPSTASSAQLKIAKALMKQQPPHDEQQESRKRKESASLPSVQMKLSRPAVPATSTTALRPADIFSADDDDDPAIESASATVDGSRTGSRTAAPHASSNNTAVSRSVNPADCVAPTPSFANSRPVAIKDEKTRASTSAASSRTFQEHKRSSRWGQREKKSVSTAQHASPAEPQPSDIVICRLVLLMESIAGSSSSEANSAMGAELELEQLRAQMKARAKALLAIERLGLPTPAADSAADIEREIAEGPTWEHRRRQAEIERLSSNTDAADAAPDADIDGGPKRHLSAYLPVGYDEALRNPREEESDYAASKLTEQNRGFQLLAKMGWTEGKGLGATQQGIVAPIKQGRSADDHQGLGADGETQPADAFDAYRRRMMEAYRHRPNPFVSPRRRHLALSPLPPRLLTPTVLQKNPRRPY
uniref:G-patch domain-containing protein n=1 Tax=Plectus sambesii TaxID=2011161 RepID=A0A914W8Y2_9BILA